MAWGAASRCLRNVEAGEVKSPEGKRDFKYLEQKRETSLTRKKLDRRLEEYDRREAGAVEALRTERGLGQAELGQLPEMQEQRNLAANVARAGQTGGLAQYTAMAPGVTYGNTLAQLGAQRMKGYGDIDLSTGEQKLNAYLNYAGQAISQANNDRAYIYAAYRDLLNDQLYQNELLYNQAQIAAQYGDYSKLKALGINAKPVTRSAGGSSRGSSGSKSGTLSTGLSPDQISASYYDPATKNIYVGGYGWMRDDQLARLLADRDNSDNPTVRVGLDSTGRYTFYKSSGPSYYGG